MQHLQAELGAIRRPPLKRDRTANTLAIEIELAPACTCRQVDTGKRAVCHGRAGGRVTRRAQQLVDIAPERPSELNAVGARGELRVRRIDEKTHLADSRVPARAEENRALRIRFL